MHSAVPHHRPEIPLQLLVTLIIPSGNILRVILIDFRYLTDPYAVGTFYVIELICDRVRHIILHRRIIVKQLGAHRKKCHIPPCRILPFRADKRIVLFLTGCKHFLA